MEQKLLSTKDYDQFKSFEMNRDCNPKHVENLVGLIGLENDLHLHPIIVDKKMQVIDGQHRLEAAKRLKVPIYYLIDENGSENKIISINTVQKKWSRDDFLNFYVSKGYEDYEKIKNLMKITKWTLSAILVWVGIGRKGGAFKNGKFICTISAEVLKAINTGKKVQEVIQLIDKDVFLTFHKDAYIHRALQIFLCSPIIDHDRFINKLQSARHLMRRRYNALDYLEIFINMYNYYEKEKVTYMNIGNTYKIMNMEPA